MSGPQARVSLSQLVGNHIAIERGRRGMSQAMFAERLGMTQQRLSRLERGSVQPTTAVIERVFAAMGLQLRFEVEPLDGGVDAEIDKYESMSAEERDDEVTYYEHLFRTLGDLRYAVTGRMGAFLQGAPVRVLLVDIVVAEGDLDAVAECFLRHPFARWDERWQEYGVRSVDPRELGPMRWRLGLYELRLEVRRDEPTGIDAPVTVRVGERDVRVLPLAAIEESYPDVGRLMTRVRARAASRGGA